MDIQLNNMKTIHAMLGPSGCGKSTYAEKLRQETQLNIVSPDAIRFEVHGNSSDQSNGDMIFKLAADRVRANLGQFDGVIIDSTSYNNRNRKWIFQLAADLGAIIKWHYFDTSLEECKYRQQSRERIVPDWVIEKQFNGLTLPEQGEIIRVL